MSGSDGHDRPGSFSADDWEPPARPADAGNTPQVPEHPPGSFVPPDHSRQERTAQPPLLTVPMSAELFLGIPWMLWGLGVVWWAAGLVFDGFAVAVVIAAWILSGLLIFWAPMDDYLARFVFHLRRPTVLEQQKLEVSWRAVCQRAAIDSQYHKLWIEESDGVNGFAMAGRSIAVTRWALNSLPPRQLQAVLAHELGHHRGGHPWATTLVLWYSLPGRLVVGLVRGLFRLGMRVPALGCLVYGFVAAAFAGLFLNSLIISNSWTWVVEAILPFLVPIGLAWCGRRVELMADLVSADFGYARDMIMFLYDLQAQGEDVARRAAGWRGALYSTQPSVAQRITALERYRQMTAS